MGPYMGWPHVWPRLRELTVRKSILYSIQPGRTGTKEVFDFVSHWLPKRKLFWILDVHPPQEGLILDKISKRKITPSISSIQ